MTTKTKKPRAKKFGHLKVGDEVVCSRRDGSRFIERITADWLRGGRGRKSLIAAGCAIIDASEEELRELREREERINLWWHLSNFDWNRLTLSQLRRVKAELDAAEQTMERRHDA